MSEIPFQFDRPGQGGFGPRTIGEGGAATGAEAQEVLADRLRDEVLRHFDPLDELTRHADLAAPDPSAGAAQGGAV